jgi:phage shock protein E
MTKKAGYTQSSNRTIIILIMAVLTLILGAVAWVSAENLNTTRSPLTPAALISPQEYQAQFVQASSHVLIDVRTPEEYASGYIQNAINIPVESLQARLSEVPENTPVVVYCRSGNRSAAAAQILVEAGFQPIFDLGGIQDWVAQGFPLQ